MTDNKLPSLKELGAMTMEELIAEVEAEEARQPKLPPDPWTSDEPIKLTWSDLVAMQPALGDLLTDCEAVEDDNVSPAFCANHLWYGAFKPRLVELAGDEAESGPPAMRTSVAYDLAYERCYDVLPPCRDCGCA